MYKLSIKFLDLAEKFAFGMWGVTILDFIPFFNLSFLGDVDIHLKAFLAVIGALYFIIQIVFKTINLDHKRKYNKNLRRIQENNIRINEMERKQIKLEEEVLNEIK